MCYPRVEAGFDPCLILADAWSGLWLKLLAFWVDFSVNSPFAGQARAYLVVSDRRSDYILDLGVLRVYVTKNNSLGTLCTAS